MLYKGFKIKKIELKKIKIQSELDLATNLTMGGFILLITSTIQPNEIFQVTLFIISFVIIVFGAKQRQLAFKKFKDLVV